MKWTEVRVRVAAEAVEAASNALIEEGAGGVAIQDPSLVDRVKRGWIWEEDGAGVVAAAEGATSPAGREMTVVAYYPTTERLAPRLARLRERLRDMARCGLDLGAGELVTTEVDDRDWADAWKAYFKPRRLGRRMVIRPSWEEYEAGPDDLVIVIDPGTAFGTGTHATTAGCLLFLEETMAGGERVIDCGTGSGILAVAAARLGAAFVETVDNDEASVIAAKANARDNGVADRVSVTFGDGGAFLDRFAAGSIDLVTANLVADLLVRLAPAFARALRPGGLVIGSGIVNTRLDDVDEAFARAGLTIVDRKTEGDWVTVLAARAGDGPAGRRPRVAVTTLGCKVNQYDSETLLGLFTRAGYDVVPAHEEADVYVINTCVVTGRAAAKSRRLVHRVARDHPGAVVAVAGCYPQTEQAEVLDIPGVDVVIGTRDRGRLLDMVEEARRSHAAEAGLAEPVPGLRLTPPGSTGGARPWSYEELPIAEFHGRTRATVKIQEGCEQYCSYCIIPYARGPVRSRRPEDVVAEVRRLAAAGFKEVVLTGIHLGAYGRDLGGTDLAAVVGRLAGLPGLARVRLSSIEPMEITPALVDLIAGGVLCRHLHVPLQSGSTRTLAAMNRHYTPDDYRRVIDAARARVPGLAVSTDVMAGFPGETEADFEDSYTFVRSLGFSRLHVFKYSRRRGTPAASMPGQVASADKTARSARLIALGEELGLAFVHGLLGAVAEVLVEGEEEGRRLEGLTDNYIRVRLDGPATWQNELIRVVLETATGPGAADGRPVGEYSQW